MQRSYLLLIFLVSYLPVYSQLHETFSDSNFTANPVWIGETAFFKISTGLELQSNGPNATSQLYLSTANTRCRDTEWNFYAKLDFDITTANWAKVYLTSDRSDTKNNPKGYYVKFEGSSNSVDLYRQDSATHTKIISGKNGRAGKTTTNIFRIKVICDQQGYWHLFSDSTASGSHFEKEGAALDTTFSSSSYCGVYFAHSATRRTQFYFDNFTISAAPLSLLSANALSATSVELTFSHIPETISATSILHYSFLPENNSIQSILLNAQNKNKVTMILSSPLNTHTNYTISAHDILDEQSNPLGFINTASFYYRINTNYGDLIFSELLPDPSPPKTLPEAEYVEFFNRTNDTLNLQGFSFTDGSSSAVFPSCTIAPHQHLLVCSASSIALFSAYSPAIGVSNFPSLNNSGDALVLKNQYGITLHAVNYTDLWYGDNNKKEGGWSLEIIDPANPCGEAPNWTASVDPSGGTPARQNSVAASKPDLLAPQLLSAYSIDSTHVQLTFDENPTINSSSFNFDKTVSIKTITIPPSTPFRVILEVSEKFAKGELYTLTVSGIQDCNGNGIYPPLLVTLILPQEASIGNILINEVLFNPKVGGYDFVELYNHSEKYIDLQNWQLANTKDGVVSNNKKIITEPLVLSPHEYIAFTANKSILLNHYPLGKSENIVQLASLPSYNDDKGSVVLIDGKNQEQDRFDYSEDFHFALIDDKEGVSLERISPHEITNNQYNWHSASSQSGYATPGYQNSQNTEETNGSQVWIEPKIFTPDENGNNDFALINYKFDTPGNLVNITIFDFYGREMLRLARNELLSTEGFYRWDGNTTLNEKARSGAYIVYFELFNLKGEVKKYKEIVVVGWRNQK